MILWLASYPKSGNTWLRLLNSNYLWLEGANIFDNLKNIPRFPKPSSHVTDKTARKSSKIKKSN